MHEASQWSDPRRLTPSIAWLGVIRRRLAPGSIAAPEILREAQVSRHWARRSSNSWSRSISRLARAVKSASALTRLISARSESTTSWFTLEPRTRATASASCAKSSGSRTVVCLVMASQYRDITIVATSRTLATRTRVEDAVAWAYGPGPRWRPRAELLIDHVRDVDKRR